QDVEDDHRSRIADMGEVVDGGPAHVHSHASRIEGLEELLLALQRVVEPEFHRTSSPGGPERSLWTIERKRSRPRPLGANNLPANAEETVAGNLHGGTMRAPGAAVKACGKSVAVARHCGRKDTGVRKSADCDDLTPCLRPTLQLSESQVPSSPYQSGEQ